jgi:hypothetical protein
MMNQQTTITLEKRTSSILQHLDAIIETKDPLDANDVHVMAKRLLISTDDKSKTIGRIFSGSKTVKWTCDLMRVSNAYDDIDPEAAHMKDRFEQFHRLMSALFASPISSTHYINRLIRLDGVQNIVILFDSAETHPPVTMKEYIERRIHLYRDWDTIDNNQPIFLFVNIMRYVQSLDLKSYITYLYNNN